MLFRSKLADIIPEAQAIELMKAAAKATYGRKGDDVVAKTGQLSMKVQNRL